MELSAHTESTETFANFVQLQGPLPPGITLISADNFEEWFMDVKVMDDNPLYINEVYRLKFRFGSSYPIGMFLPDKIPWTSAHELAHCLEAPEVTFVQDASHPIPMHPHVYSNGIICLDLLDTSGWSPVQNVESVCVSLQSMLTGNSKNERPPGNDAFVRTNRQRPRDINFVFHDNKV